MPVIGEFHRKYWRFGGAPPPPPSTGAAWMYPGWQSTVTMMMVAFGPPWSLFRPLWDALRWWVVLLRRVARLDQAHRGALLEALARLEADPTLTAQRTVSAVLACTPAQRAVLDSVMAVLTGPLWAPATAAVAACATTPKFHQAEQWVEWSRAIKANKGQAQNVFRHLKAVQAVRGLSDADGPVSNPDAHLVVELAYQALAATQATRKPARLIEHPARLIDHPVLHRRQG